MEGAAFMHFGMHFPREARALEARLAKATELIRTYRRHTLQARIENGKLRRDLQESDAVMLSHRTAHEKLARQVHTINVALETVAAYEGMNPAQATVAYVQELVRDHEELEARIDAVMGYLAPLLEDGQGTGPEGARHIAALLQGAARVPDTAEELDEETE